MKVPIKPVSNSRASASPGLPRVGGRPATLGGQGVQARPGVPAKPAQPPANPYKLKQPESSGSSSTVWIVVGVISAVVALGILIAVSSSRPRRAASPTSELPFQVSSGPGSEPERYNELGGKSMREYCADNDRNSKDLQDRKSRMKTRKPEKIDDSEPTTSE